MKVGDQASLRVKVTDAMVRSFADIIGDQNPVHLDDAFAATTIFKQRIAHGMLPASLISAALATKLPGPGTIYVSQDLAFRRPVHIDDTLDVLLKVIAIGANRRVTLETWVERDGKAVVDGTAVVLAPG